MQGRLIFALLFSVSANLITTECYAIHEPHPQELYARGLEILKTYRGNTAHLKAAQDIFQRLVEKYPDSPFGYLGMSRAKIIEAYRSGNHYNMVIIGEEALPLTFQAMRTGPTLRDVQENFDLLGRILKHHDDNQEQARQLLLQFPDHPQTYFHLGALFSDQGELEKSLEYYKMVLSLAPEEELRLQTLLRIGYLYLEEFKRPADAIEYFQEASNLRGDAAAVHEYLGRAYYSAGRSAETLGQREAANRYYKQYLKVVPDSDEAKRIRQNIPDLSHD